MEYFSTNEGYYLMEYFSPNEVGRVKSVRLISKRKFLNYEKPNVKTDFKIFKSYEWVITFKKLKLY
ncbi:unnamed protein product [Meloidogyne enterolobii]|uniref:Uncharacterized protein n=1 Tax=Meloidogyne enterolobii TaxID=390850 RepID=A0ACB0ZWS8_MELEN